MSFCSVAQNGYENDPRILERSEESREEERAGLRRGRELGPKEMIMMKARKTSQKRVPFLGRLAPASLCVCDVFSLCRAGVTPSLPSSLSSSWSR